MNKIYPQQPKLDGLIDALNTITEYPVEDVAKALAKHPKISKEIIDAWMSEIAKALQLHRKKDGLTKPQDGKPKPTIKTGK